eukprot:scaffold39121_cov139-Skeletonema_marinoi.AAC.5
MAYTIFSGLRSHGRAHECEGERLIEGEALTLSAAAGTGRRESVTPRPAASAVINTQKIANIVLFRLCFHHGSSGSTGVASYTVS